MINPVKGFKMAYFPKGDITQYFAENPVLYSRFGLAGHNGIDIVRPHGEPIYSVCSGIVVESKHTTTGYGKYIRVVSDQPDRKGVRQEWTYGHNSKNMVETGQVVKEGEIIALMGNTGFVVSGATPFWKFNPFAGTHLHLGLRLCKLSNKGWSYSGSDIKLAILDHQNGYYGSINPAPYLSEANDVPEATAWREMALTVISLANTVINLLKK